MVLIYTCVCEKFVKRDKKSVSVENNGNLCLVIKENNGAYCPPTDRLGWGLNAFLTHHDSSKVHTNFSDRLPSGMQE